MRKYLKVLQGIAIFTLVCTIIIFVGLLVASAVPGSESGATTNMVTEFLDNTIGLSDKIQNKVNTYRIDTYVKDRKSRYYTDDTAQLITNFAPWDTKDREVRYYTDNTQVATVDENGLITFRGLGRVYVYVELKSNKSVSSKVQFWCYGEYLFDPAHPERMTVGINGSSGILSKIAVGKKKKLVINDGKSDFQLVSIYSSNSNILFYNRGYIYGRKEGECNVVARFVNGSQIYEYSIPVTVTAGELPEIELKAKDNLELYQEGHTAGSNLLDISDDIAQYYYDCVITSSNNNIISISNNNNLRITGTGKVKLTYRSCFDANQVINIEVDVKKPTPEKLLIFGSDAIMPLSKTSYRTTNLPIDYNNNVTWSIVSGRGTISEKGELYVSGYGKVVIRCTYKGDSSIYAEKVVRVKLFTSGYMFVRKFMGHAGLSCVLGFCLTAIFFQLAKRKWATVLTIPIGFVYAAGSEYIQNFTPGRYATWADVFVDFVGVFIGMGVALACIGIAYVLWNLINKGSFKKYRKAYKILTFKTVFKKISELERIYNERYCVETVAADNGNGNITTDLLTEPCEDVVTTDNITDDNGDLNG